VLPQWASAQQLLPPQFLPPGLETPLGVPILERPHPAYDPIGIRLGEFLALPRIGVSEAFDDNIYAFRQKTSDFITRITPGIDVDSTWSRHALGMSATGAITRYASHGTEDYDAMRLGGYGRVDVYRDAAIALYGFHRRDADPRSDPESLVNRQSRAIFDEDRARLLYVQRLMRFDLTTSFTFDRFDYVQVQNQDQNRSDYTAAERIAYYFSPRVNGFFETSYDITSYAQNGPARDYDTWTNLVGSAFDIDSVFIGELGVGILHQTSRNSAIPDFDGLAARGRVIWNVTLLTSLIAAVERAQEATRIQGAFSRLRTYGLLEAQHELRRNIILRANYSYEQNDYQGIVLKQSTHTMLLEARYLLNRNFSLGAAYVFRDRVATGATSNLFNFGSFNENIISANVTARF
jgi:hypothetical protein